MRLRFALIATLCLSATGLGAPAEAFWRRSSDGLDPYRYRAEPRRYYPFYNSWYWRSAREIRHRRACCRPDPVLPPYYAAWGHPTRYHMHRSRQLRDHRGYWGRDW